MALSAVHTSIDTTRTLPYTEQAVPLADKNWFATGGAAEYFSEPKTPKAFQEVVRAAHAYELPLCLLGKGANMLVSDAGVPGLVIRPRLETITAQECGDHALVTAGAGVDFHKLIMWCITRQYLGLEEFSGIPGTVGGGVFINIHYFEFLLSQFIEYAQVIEHGTGNLLTVEREWFNFGYNTSRLHDKTHSLVSATFKLRIASEQAAAHAKGRSQEMIRHRAQRYPTHHTCGSFFRNFTTQEVRNTPSQLIYVAYYLDKLGIKGELSVGDAVVSHKHANMIVNRGNATSHDIVMLARTMQQRVFDAFGIIPQPECRFVGFSTYPLHTHL